MFSLGSAHAQGISKQLDPTVAKWIDVRQTDWLDEEGKLHQWEFVTRKSRPPGMAHAVYILALVVFPDGSVAVPIVVQYCPPVDALVVEFPAGLVEEGESEVECALRELYEETGLGRKGAVEVVGISKALCGDAAVSAEVIKRVEIVIRLKQDRIGGRRRIDQFSENEEHIMSGLVILQTFPDMIDGLAEKPR